MFPVSGFKQPPMLQGNVPGDHALLNRVFETVMDCFTDA